MNSKSLIRFAIAGLILIVAAVGIGPYLLKWKAKQRVSANERETLKEWGGRSFVSISNLESVRRLVADSIENILASTPATPLQKQRLTAAMVNFCSAFSKGSFEAYASFRFPNGDSRIELDPLRGTGLHQALQDESFSIPPFKLIRQGSAPSYSTNRPITVARAFWEDRVRCLFDPATQAPAYCFDSLTGVAEDGIQVEFTTGVVLPPSIMSMCNADNSLGFFRKPSFFRILPTPENILSRHKTLDTAMVSMLIETSLPVRAFPVFVHYYWDPDTSNWIAYELVVGVANNEDIDFFF